MNDGDTLIAWVREAADELEKAHAYLDVYEVPRSIPGTDAECTLAARISLALERGATREDRCSYCGEEHEVTTVIITGGLPVKTCPQVPDSFGPIAMPGSL